MVTEEMKSEIERAIRASALSRLSKGKLVDMVITLREELAERSEEQGRLVKLPCKVGDTVYFIPQYGGKPYCGIQDGHVQHISLSKKGYRIRVREHHPHNIDFAFGKTVFLTREAAKAALKEMEADNGTD